MKVRRITHASARQKGRLLELTIAKKLQAIGINAKRVPMSGGGSIKGDVVEFGQVPQHLHECKNHQALSLNSWWGQTLVQCTDGEVPALHFTSNYKPIYTMLDSETFDGLLFAYEDRHRELIITMLDLPRKNFWSVATDSRYTIYLTDDRVILMFDLYVMLRRASLSKASA